MKLWHLAAILAVLGIAYVLITRPTVPTTVGATPASSNALFAGLATSVVNFGSKVFSSTPTKAAAPSAIVDVGADQGTFQQGDSSVSGNTLVNSSGDTLTYGTD
jgi:hypothetical protein